MGRSRSVVKQFLRNPRKTHDTELDLLGANCAWKVLFRTCLSRNQSEFSCVSRGLQTPPANEGDPLDSRCERQT
jgi:hypothetical protein